MCNKLRILYEWILACHQYLDRSTRSVHDDHACWSWIDWFEMKYLLNSIQIGMMLPVEALTFHHPTQVDHIYQIPKCKCSSMIIAAWCCPSNSFVSSVLIIYLQRVEWSAFVVCLEWRKYSASTIRTRSQLRVPMCSSIGIKWTRRSAAKYS